MSDFLLRPGESEPPMIFDVLRRKEVTLGKLFVFGSEEDKQFAALSFPFPLHDIAFAVHFSIKSS